MVKNKTIQIRVTKNQHERIPNNARAKGYVSIYSYLRDLGLNHDSNIERKIDEIYKKIITIE